LPWIKIAGDYDTREAVRARNAASSEGSSGVTPAKIGSGFGAGAAGWAV
jgi:hypothetical protein